MENNDFLGLVAAFEEVPGVVAIVLGGSRATGVMEADSDYDLYIYYESPIDKGLRQSITDRFCSYMELANRFWEEEDDGILLSGSIIEIIYRHARVFEEGLRNHLVDNVAYGGYTTCNLASVVNGIGLYDPMGWFNNLKASCQPYPQALKQAIIHKNRALLSGIIPSYDQQILKAIKRQDLPSINHRITEFMASYFDVIFALNGVYHPGEKRMISIAKTLFEQPDHMVEDLTQLYLMEKKDHLEVGALLDKIIRNLDAVIDEFETR